MIQRTSAALFLSMAIAANSSRAGEPDCDALEITVAASFSNFELTIEGSITNGCDTPVEVFTGNAPQLDFPCGGEFYHLSAGLGCGIPENHRLELDVGENCDYMNYYFDRICFKGIFGPDPDCYRDHPPPGTHTGSILIGGVERSFEFTVEAPVPPATQRGEPPLAVIAAPSSNVTIELVSGEVSLALDATGSSPGADADEWFDELRLTWSTIAGPAAVQFSNPHGLQTLATFHAPGEYLVQLEAEDGFPGCQAGLFYPFDGSDTASVSVSVTGAEPAFLRGDTNQDGRVDLSDAVSTLSQLFLGSTPSSCPDAVDANDDGAEDISDAIATLGFLFLGTPVPPLSLGACAADATADSLRPCSYPAESCPVAP